MQLADVGSPLQRQQADVRLAWTARGLPSRDSFADISTHSAHDLFMRADCPQATSHWSAPRMDLHERERCAA